MGVSGIWGFVSRDYLDNRPFFLEMELVSRLVFDKLDEGASGILCMACIQC